MKNNTLKRIHNRFDILPVYFVDSSVFLEVLLNQSYSGKCIEFFNNVGYHYRLMTSTLVLGEILKLLNDAENSIEKENGLFYLISLLERTDILVAPISFACISNIQTVIQAYSHLESSDTIIFSSAITENCKAFITLDSDFSKRIGVEFDIMIKKPLDA